MRRPTSLPILVQVAALSALSVMLALVVSFAVVVMSPEPRPSGFSVSAAADALMGEPAQTSDGRTLRRRILDAPPEVEARHFPFAPLVRRALAQRLDVSPERVQVWSPPPPRTPFSRGPDHPPLRMGEQHQIILSERRGPERSGTGNAAMIQRQSAPRAGPMPPPVRSGMSGPQAEIRLETHVFEGGPNMDWVFSESDSTAVLAERLTFAPFSAAVQLNDGRWAVVEPPHGLLSPWQSRTLLALLISLLLMAPLVWWMARRLVRPIRAFAEAADRLGADPEAHPLEPTGPAEVRTAITAFNGMQASLKDHIRNRTQSVAAIAHDLRTPLTRLRFRAEQAPDSLRDRMAEDIEEMDALISQALTYARGDSAPHRHEAFDLSELARDVTQDFIETGTPARFTSNSQLPIEADPVALRRALSNLIDNARVWAQTVTVETHQDGDQAVVTVSDDGPGLPPDQLEALFEPFRRGETSRNRQTGGTGLGLTVARQAARAHGGDVTLSNRPEGGLKARISLPLAAPV